MTPRTRSTLRRTARAGHSTSSSPATTTTGATRSPDNSLSHNGFFGNETNGDLAEISQPHDPGNCWHGNFHPDASPVTSAPANLQVTHATCGIPNQGASLFDPLAAQVICATQAFGPCPADTPGMMYPRPTNVQMLPLPAQPSMPSPCSGVPNTPWCKNPHGAG